nr:hypothetical protein [Anaeromyxobacter sp. SG66]
MEHRVRLLLRQDRAALRPDVAREPLVVRGDLLPEADDVRAGVGRGVVREEARLVPASLRALRARAGLRNELRVIHAERRTVEPGQVALLEEVREVVRGEGLALSQVFELLPQLRQRLALEDWRNRPGHEEGGGGRELTLPEGLPHRGHERRELEPGVDVLRRPPDELGQGVRGVERPPTTVLHREQRLVRLRLLERVGVLAAGVLDDAELVRLLVGEVLHGGRQVLQPDLLRGAVPPLAVHDLEPRALRPDLDRLLDPVLANGRDQLVDVACRPVPRRRVDVVDRDEPNRQRLGARGPRLDRRPRLLRCGTRLHG